MTQLIPQLELETDPTSLLKTTFAPRSQQQQSAMTRSDLALFKEKLKTYCIETKQQQTLSRNQDLANKVRYICNDLELILAELQSPAFTAFNTTQQHWLEQSQTAVQNAMKHLDLTHQSVPHTLTE